QTGSDSVSGEQVPLFHPRKHRWRDHFAWSEDGTEVLGLTPTGRATVVALHLNREGLLNLRRLLFAAGEHPPPEPGSETGGNSPPPPGPAPIAPAEKTSDAGSEASSPRPTSQ